IGTLLKKFCSLHPLLIVSVSFTKIVKIFLDVALQRRDASEIRDRFRASARFTQRDTQAADRIRIVRLQLKCAFEWLNCLRISSVFEMNTAQIILRVPNSGILRHSVL